MRYRWALSLAAGLALLVLAIGVVQLSASEPVCDDLEPQVMSQAIDLTSMTRCQNGFINKDDKQTGTYNFGTQSCDGQDDSTCPP